MTDSISAEFQTNSVSPILSGSNVVYQKLILCRRISTNSIRRHFSSWKMRHIVVSSTKVSVTKSANEDVTIASSKDSNHISEDVKVLVSVYSGCNMGTLQHHPYTKYGKHCLSLKYTEEDEILMKFDTKRDMEECSHNILQTIKNCDHYIQQMCKPLLHPFREFLLEQKHLQDIVLNQDTGSEKSRTSESSRISDESIGQHSEFDLSKFSLPIPKMNIVLMAVGTRGDVQPFGSIGLKLKADGHRVRIATHSSYRQFVADSFPGLEFYPLAGDPRKLSEFMVKNNGCIIPMTTDILREMPEYHSMIVDIIHSTWDACTKPDPLYTNREVETAETINIQDIKFVADAIISNPVTYGHIHCAEALGVPLHLMFPQPWVPTKAFPHPLSCLSYNQPWCLENSISYQMVERMLWLSFESSINSFRTDILKLPPIRTGEGGWNLLNLQRVPFVNMWSPHLVPKPKDWPDYVDVVGNFGDNTSKNSDKDDKKSPKSFSATETYIPSDDLKQFLDTEVPIIFVGFGSMVIKNFDRYIGIFLKAAALVGVKIIIQTGWSEMTPELFENLGNMAQIERSHADSDDENFECLMKDKGFHKAPLLSAVSFKSVNSSVPEASNATNYEDISEWNEVKLDNGWRANKHSFLLGSVPHSWLFRHVSAVVHHGGAGTTASSLSSGLPTWICPFFGDQYFWGKIVSDEELGPPPMRLDQVDLDTVVNAFNILLDTSTITLAKIMGERMKQEDGASKAVEAFYRHLPLENMLCDISILRGNYFQQKEMSFKDDSVERTSKIENFVGLVPLARVYCRDCGFKMSTEVSTHIHGKGGFLERENHSLTQCCYVNWAVPSPSSATDGLVQGLGNLLHEISEGVTGVIYDPVKGVYTEGVNGGAAGLVSGINKFINTPFKGGKLMMTKMKQGVDQALKNRNENSESPTLSSMPTKLRVAEQQHSKAFERENIRVEKPMSLDDFTNIESSHNLDYSIMLEQMQEILKLPTVNSALGVASDHTVMEDANSTLTRSISPLIEFSKHENDKTTHPSVSSRGNNQSETFCLSLDATVVSDSDEDEDGLLDGAHYDPTLEKLCKKDIGLGSLNDASSLTAAMPASIKFTQVLSTGEKQVYSSFFTSNNDTPNSNSKLKIPSNNDYSDNSAIPTSNLFQRDEAYSLDEEEEINVSLNFCYNEMLRSRSDANYILEESVSYNPSAVSNGVRNKSTQECFGIFESVNNQLSVKTGDINTRAEIDMTEAALLKAKNVREIFSKIGAIQRRFISFKEFSKLVDRAVHRYNALIPPHPGNMNSNLEQETLIEADSIPEAAIAALAKLFTGNKNYIDFVNFALFYAETIDK